MRFNAFLFGTLACLAVVSCKPAPSPTLLATMRFSYASGDFFTLDDLLRDSVSSRFNSPEIALYRATTHNFYNRLDLSETTIADYYETLDKTNGNDTLRFDLTRIRLDNALKQQRYGDAATFCDSLTSRFRRFWNGEALAQLSRLKPIVVAVGQVVPMTCEKMTDTQLTIGYDKQQHPKIPITVGKFADELSLDLSTQFCMLSETVAKHLELRVLAGEFTAQNTLGKQQKASIAVADRLQIGNAVLRNVPFLVFDDKAMVTRGDSTPVHGTLGYGVLAALQEVVFTSNHELLIPKNAPLVPNAPNFGLVWYTPLLRSTVNGQLTPLRLDFSARRSSLQERLVSDSSAFQAFKFRLGINEIKMDSVLAVRTSGVQLQNNGTIGRDIFKSVAALRINFAAMRVGFE